MKQSHKYALALEALMELSQELKEASYEPAGHSSRLEVLLQELGPLPPEALLLGIAEDGLPVLLNLQDSLPGPLLVTGGELGNKTNFLKMIAQVIARTHDPRSVQYGVITPAPGEWGGYEEGQSCAGIIPVYENKANDFILSLNAWAHANKTNQVVVLLVDGLDQLSKWDQLAVDNFRWLLMRGPARRVWPIVTLNDNKMSDVVNMLTHFRTKIYSVAGDNQLPSEAGGLISQGVESRQDGADCRFVMKEGSHWLHFRCPMP